MREILLGLETESLHLLFQHKKIDVFDFVDITNNLGLDGVQINIIPDLNLNPRFGTLKSNDKDYLESLDEKITSLGLYCEIDTRYTSIEYLKEDLQIAKTLNSKVLRTYLKIINLLTKFDLDRAILDLRSVIPLLEKFGICLALENHEWETSEDLLYIVESLNHPLIGVLYDTGNSMMVREDPFKAVNNLKDFIKMVHFKDHVVCMNGYEPVISGAVLGEGNIDVSSMFDFLANNTSVTHINLENCYPYSATIKDEEMQKLRLSGALMSVDKFTTDGFKFENIFEIKHAPLPSFISPMDYYYPHKISEQALEILIKYQKDCVEKSVKKLIGLRDSYLERIKDEK